MKVVTHQTPPQNYQDSGIVFCPPGVWTTLIDPSPFGGEWMQMNGSAGVIGSLLLGQGAAGVEVQFFHSFFDAGFNGSLFNIRFRAPEGVRISCNPTVAFTCEYHIYF